LSIKLGDVYSNSRHLLKRWSSRFMALVAKHGDCSFKGPLQPCNDRPLTTGVACVLPAG
jgi:hypothetical protein